MIWYKTTQKFDNYQSNISSRQPSVNTSKDMDEKQFQNHVLRMYGFEDMETNSSVSSRRSSVEEEKTNSTGQSTPIEFETTENFKPKQITIREYYPSRDMPSLMVNRSESPSASSQQTIEDNEYERVLQNHPDLYNDPNPEIITQPNPEQVTYQQNVSIRYLVPPTPPPPGPLIIRGMTTSYMNISYFRSLEILPPRAPTPPPLVIKQQDPSPPTPPPLILREAPPPLPPQQDAQVITKVLPQEPPPPQRVIVERTPPVYLISIF